MLVNRFMVKWDWTLFLEVGNGVMNGGYDVAPYLDRCYHFTSEKELKSFEGAWAMVVRYNWMFCGGILVLSLLTSMAWAAPEDESLKSELTLEELDAELAALDAELAALNSESDVEKVVLKSEEEEQNKEDSALALEYYSQGVLGSAMELWTAAALRNYTPAQTRLGFALDYAQFDILAVGWLMMAASQGHAEGELGLGGMYLKGEGLQRDLKMAAYWIRAAAEQDFAPAIKMMDAAYREPDSEGNFLGAAAKDKQQAEYWAEKQKVIGGEAEELRAERDAYERKKYIDSFFEDSDAVDGE